MPNRGGGENNSFKRLSATPEGKALMDMWRASRWLSKATWPGRKLGATEGFTKKERNKLKAKAKAEAKEIVKYMSETKGFEIPKQEYAKESIEMAVTIMRRTDIHPKDQLAAAKTILEWTLAKPASESTVNVKSAESFLDDIAGELGMDKRAE